MRANRTSGSMRGRWCPGMCGLVRHRQTKGAGTDRLALPRAPVLYSTLFGTLNPARSAFEVVNGGIVVCEGIPRGGEMVKSPGGPDEAFHPQASSLRFLKSDPSFDESAKSQPHRLRSNHN